MTSSKDNNWYVRTVCAILFFVFSLLYLYHYQAGLIAYTQHVCSGGQTQYNRVIGTVLMVGILGSIHKKIYTSLRNDKYYLFAAVCAMAFLLLSSVASKSYSEFSSINSASAVFP